MDTAFDPALPAETRLDAFLARSGRLVVLGMGNTLLGDDAVGHRVAEDVAALGRKDLVGLPVGIALENAYGLVGRAEPARLLIVDAVAMEDLGPGAWDLWPPDGLGVAIHSTHSVPLPLFVQMWQQDLPGLEVAFLGINLGGAALGAGLTGSVAMTRAAILARIAAR